LRTSVYLLTIIHQMLCLLTTSQALVFPGYHPLQANNHPKDWKRHLEPLVESQTSQLLTAQSECTENNSICASISSDWSAGDKNYYLEHEQSYQTIISSNVIQATLSHAAEQGSPACREPVVTSTFDSRLPLSLSLSPATTFSGICLDSSKDVHHGKAGTSTLNEHFTPLPLFNTACR